MGAGGMQQQLRFDAVDLRRVEQQFEQMPQQSSLRMGVQPAPARGGFGVMAKTSPMTALVSS